VILRRSLARVIDEFVVTAAMLPWVLLAGVFLGLGEAASEEDRREIAVLATGIIAGGVAIGGCYEGVTTMKGGGVGKRLAGLRVASINRTALTARKAFSRWVLLVGPTPLVWLSLGIGGTGSDYRGAVRGLIAISLVWRLTIAVSVLATTGRGGFHDQVLGSRVYREMAGTPATKTAM
jgi:uncharacterized RDD family membrane protein YckC